jgi:MFS transporter, AAHS family, 4-hydroxybenzoate transporter
MNTCRAATRPIATGGPNPSIELNPQSATVPHGAIDFSAELASAPLRLFHVRAGLLISLILLFDGYDLYNAAYIVREVAGAWHLTPQLIGVLLSSGLAGFAAGSAMSGFLADRIGRRTVLILGCWIASALSLAIALFVHDLHSYLVLRVLMGVGLGLLMPAAVTWLNEFAPARISNLFTASIFSMGWLVGASSSGLFAAWLMPRYGWESLYFAGATLLPLSGLLRWLPESPAFLANRSRWTALSTLLTRIRPERSAFYAAARFSSSSNAPRTSFTLLLSSSYLPRSLCFWCAGMLSLFCAYSLSTWLPTILVARGTALSTSFALGSLLAVAAAGGGLVTAIIADRLGDRRRVIAFSYVFGACAVIALETSRSPFAVFLAVTAAGMFMVGSQIVLNNFVAASYPISVRGTGVGLFLGLARLGAVLGPAFTGIARQWSGSYDLAFMMVAVAALLTALLVFCVPPPALPANGNDPAGVGPAEAVNSTTEFQT